MNQQSLPELISQCQELLSEICQHPEYKALDYHPDVTLGDATQALNELNWSVDSANESRANAPSANHCDRPVGI
ncbi:hypothetical protein VB735_17390 [Halotia wernerae UHCC 0503]|nr:hypothetical protein [Halotia wernerae UHCC 0503]